MRHSTGPRYFPSKNGFFAEVNGVKKRLTSGPKTAQAEREAWEQYRKLGDMLRRGGADAKALGGVVNCYLSNARERLVPPPLAPNTYRIHEAALTSFIRFEYQGRPLAQWTYGDLTIQAVEAWAAAGKARGWSDNYVHLRLRVLRTCFKWAEAHDGATKNVFLKRHFPHASLGIKHVAVTEQESRALILQADTRQRGSFGLFLRLLYDTGARPAELYMARADEWDASLRGFVIDPADPRNVGRLKNRRHLLRAGKKRVIRVPAVLAERLPPLMEQFPEGPLFRQENGKPWPDARGIGQRFKSLVTAVNRYAAEQGRPGVREEVCMYSFRHAYITRWLTAGRPEMLLCELLNTSVDMLQKHYSHLFEQHAVLSAAVEDAATHRESPSGPELFRLADEPEEASSASPEATEPKAAG
jgi:integrase